ncbi:hypothetical protein TWF730_007185 [Orbilia blumenaviensis]|uniref:Uncharacterized protein n=1 Tax=Orbilia blumenaviensis TaxID=1796055 RepID=A0AAV9V8T4_9PEZI
MASKLQLPPLNFESRGSLTADFHIPDSPPHSRPGSPSSRYQSPTDVTANDGTNASSRLSKPKTQLGLANKPSSSSLQVSPNSPPMSPQSPRPVSVRRLLSKMSLSGSYKESDEASIMSLKSPTNNTSQTFLKDRDSDVASERALSISSKGFFSSFRRNSSKRSVSSSSGRKASLPPPPTPREREPTISEKAAEVVKKDPAPQIPDLPQASVSSFDTDLFKNI